MAGWNYARRVALVLGTLLSVGAISEAATPLKIMPLGDSITHGNAGYASYRYPLFFKLKAAGLDVDFVGTQSSTEDDAGVIARKDSSNAPQYPLYQSQFDRDNQGMSSRNAAFIKDNIVSYATANRPDVVLLMIGTNDRPGMSNGTPVDTIVSNIGGIITNLRSVNPDVRVFLGEVIPGARCEPTALASLNGKIDQLGPTMSTARSPVHVVDLYSTFDLNAYTQSDKVHTNVAGENFMADQWFSAMQGAGIVPEPGVAIVAVAGMGLLMAPAATRLVATCRPGASETDMPCIG